MKTMINLHNYKNVLYYCVLYTIHVHGLVSFFLILLARLTVPSYLAGTPDLQVTSNTNLNQIVETTTFTSSATKELTLFPGKCFIKENGKCFIKENGKCFIKEIGKHFLKVNGECFLKVNGECFIKVNDEFFIKVNGKSFMKVNGECFVKREL